MADLPWQGRAVSIAVLLRRFRCASATCSRKIFAERLPDIVAAHARRSCRLADIQRHIGLALGGAAGGRLSHRLALPTSGDTLLRLIRQGSVSPARPAPTVIGIDDFAWKRGNRYGTVICDLERRCIIDLLPDRQPATVEAWLAANPGISVVARDRGAGYGHADSRARPQALQVADRWHLMENASAAFLQAVRHCMRPIRRALAAGTVDLDVLTCAERRQYEGFLRREADNVAIRRLFSSGMGIKEIVRRTSHSRKVVRDVVRGGRTDVFRSRADAATSLLASFAKGLATDQAAVTAAMIEPWSNGQTEGRITKLKMIKRQMYGRANLDLLRARLCQV